MRTIIKGGNVIDPGNITGIKDIVVENSKILEIIDNAEVKPDDNVIDAAGLTVTPGLIDMHVHLREPGHEYKETIESGCSSAAAGGFTTVCAMPNTKPVNDCRQVTEFIIQKAKEAGKTRVLPVGAISTGLSGESLCEYGELKDAGVCAVSDDGMPVDNPQLMRRALEYAKGFNLFVISHCEDLSLAANGSMNESSVSTRLGLGGIPNASESVMVLRDIALCELTQGKLHIAHVSTKESVQAIREAKRRGVNVTAETAPHYFTLTDIAVDGYNTLAKMNPPLRSQEDLEAIQEGLKDGTLDVIATDHAPHSALEKDVEFDRAANGIVGLETSLALTLVKKKKKVLSMTDLVEKMSKNPGKILGIDNSLKPGNCADITIFDENLDYCVESKNFSSLSKNMPYESMELKGRAVYTIVDGKVVYEHE